MSTDRRGCFLSESPHRHALKVVVAQPRHDDGEAISTADDQLTEKKTTTVRDALMPPCALVLPADEFADIVAHPMLIESAIGMLMLIYDLDADNAVELLKWGSRALNIEIRVLSRRLTEDLVGGAHHREGHARCERVDLRSACDDVLFTAHDPASPVSRPGREP